MKLWPRLISSVPTLANIRHHLLTVFATGRALLPKDGVVVRPQKPDLSVKMYCSDLSSYVAIVTHLIRFIR